MDFSLSRVQDAKRSKKVVQNEMLLYTLRYIVFWIRPIPSNVSQTVPIRSHLLKAISLLPCHTRHIGVLTHSATFKQWQIILAVLNWYLNATSCQWHRSVKSGRDTDFLSWLVTLALPLDNLYFDTAGRTNHVSHVSGVTLCHASFR